MSESFEPDRPKPTALIYDIYLSPIIFNSVEWPEQMLVLVKVLYSWMM